MLTSLFSLFYVTREFHRFLHRGKAPFRAEYEGRKAYLSVQAEWLGRRPFSSVNLLATLNYIYGLAWKEPANFANK